MKIMQTSFQKGSHISSLVPEDGRLRSTLSQDWLIALMALIAAVIRTSSICALQDSMQRKACPIAQG